MGRKHDYNYASSDSECEESSVPTSPRRNRRRQQDPQKPRLPQTIAPQSSSDANSEEKKKKKKKSQKPPQESINSIWEKFSQKKFSKALAVLPFAPVQASVSGERGNEPISAGYERAAEECRRKVRKIISECKRVNTRYRDPGWDLVSHTIRFSNFLIEPSNLRGGDAFTLVEETVADNAGNRIGTSSGGRGTPSTL